MASVTHVGLDDSPLRDNPLCRLLALTDNLEIGGVIATLPELVQACLNVAQVCKKLGVTRQALQPPPQLRG